MLAAWFWLVAAMLAAYVVLDGFDLGAGALHLFVARTEEERQLVLRSIGPVWDGNEVWLIAGGGTLYFAFPRLYAVAFSGFYLPLMIVLWLLILRGVGIELRMQLESLVWRRFFDGWFGLGSLLLCVFLGAALGNVLRGVPLQPDGYFFLPLWTDGRPGARPGVLDWYTVLAGGTALAALGLHGALYLTLKNSGELNVRARAAARRLWPLAAALSAGSLAATIAGRPALLANYRAAPALAAIPCGAAAALAAAAVLERAGRELYAFLASCAYLALMLGGAAAAMYPRLLVSTTDPALDLTVYAAHSGEHSLAVGLAWWGAGMAAAVGYNVFVYRSFRGKVAAGAGVH
jgi:cytochrome d ubiquinol oxidase subunit II